MRYLSLLAALGACSVALPQPALAQAEATASQASGAPAPAAEEENSGQDPTRPVTRFDLRAQYSDLPGAYATETVTLRVDKPFDLGGGWKLNTRGDLPFQLSDRPGPDNPGGDAEFGLADILIQALAITPQMNGWAIAIGSQLIMPTGTQQQFTSGKWQLVPTVAAVKQLPDISPGTFAGLLVRDTFSFAGSRSRADINVLSVEPLLNIALPNRWFVTFGPEAKFNTRDDWRLFLPFDATIGTKVAKNVVVSLQADVAIVDDYQSYDWKAEFRVGFFF